MQSNTQIKTHSVMTALTRRLARGLTPILLAIAITGTLTGPAAHAETENRPQDPASLWADFNHYVRIARPDLAHAAATALMQAVDDQTLLDTVEAGQYQDYDQTLLRASRVESIKDTAKELEERIQAARVARSREVARILDDIQRLAQGQRANANALERLKAAGQFAAPHLLATLLDEDQEPLHPWVMSAMVQIGRPLLYPLCVALPDLEAVPMGQIAQTLAEIGYPEALPVLKEVIDSPDTDNAARKIAQAALNRLAALAGTTDEHAAATLYLALGLQSYDAATFGDEIVGYDPTNDTGVIWEYSIDAGLVPIPVPGPVFGDVLAMRSARRALQLDPDRDAALSLWLMANLRRENRLPAGAIDLSYAKTQLEPRFYTSMAGPLRQHDVLDRALRDADAELALDAIAALDATAGTHALINQDGTIQPLLRALYYRSRRVRFAAAFALVKSRPHSDFPSSHRVIPVLAEAVRQTHVKQAIALADDQQTANSLVATLTDLGFQAVGGQSLADVSDQMASGPGVDLIVVEKSVEEVENLYHQSNADYKLASVPVVAICTPASQIELHRRMQDNPRMALTILPTESDALRATIAQASTAYAGTPISQPEAAALTSQALALLRDVASGPNYVFDIQDAQPALIQALDDRRPNIPQQSAQVLAVIPHPAAQQAIAHAALDPTRPNAARVSLLDSLAESATHYGNHLTDPQLAALLKLVQTSRAQVAVSAATAHGALTLPTANVVQLISE